MAKTLGKVIDDIDSIISSYTDQSSHEARKEVVNLKTGQAGIIVSENIPNPKDNSGRGFMVQWKNTGGSSWYPMKTLDGLNSEIKPVSQELKDLFSTATEVNI